MRPPQPWQLVEWVPVRDAWTIGAVAALHVYSQLQFQLRELMVPNRV